MEKLVSIIEKNKRLFLIVVSAVMFILLAFFPALDIAGKAKVNGFKVVFEGSGLGFPRFIMFLMLVIPLIIVICQFFNQRLKEAVKDNLELLCFTAAIVLFIIFAICLNTGLSAAIGAYLYLVFGIIGFAGCYLTKTSRK